MKATRCSEAETLLRLGVADIVLLDLDMTGVPGTKLLQAALKARPDRLVIVMIGWPSIDSRIQALRDGAWNFIPKPFAAPHLQALVGRAALTVLGGRETKRLNDGTTPRSGGARRVTLLGRYGNQDAAAPTAGYHAALDTVLAPFEKDYLTWLLRQAGGNMSEAARVAGVDRTTLYRLLRKQGLEKGALLID